MAKPTPSSRRCGAPTRSTCVVEPLCPALNFLVAPPGFFAPTYQVSLDEQFAESLDLVVPDDAALLAIVTPRNPVQRSTVNLFSPIVVNRHTGMADQYVPASSEAETGWSVRTPLPFALGGRRSRRRHDMLTLTREPGQKIVVGDDIVITVVSVSENGRVRLGIEAPRQIRIDREEVLARIQNENIEAGAAGSSSGWAAYAARRANRQAGTAERRAKERGTDSRQGAEEQLVAQR